MLQGLKIPGRTRPTAREVYRAEVGEHVDWLPPEKKYEKGKDRPGVLVCPRCHAISLEKRWFLDENRFQQLCATPGVQFVICPGCQRIERQIYDGEVRLCSLLLLHNKPQALAIIRHEEDKARQTNPFSRLAAVVDRGDEIDILTTTRWLAERIGKSFHKAFKGSLKIQHLPDERFVRVRWKR
ncbi:MAG TPA: hypothetical protein VMW65_04730 [Chloroflexota bacterium]|nr:hypothetical protein [Chloroflexota bacterium]